MPPSCALRGGFAIGAWVSLHDNTTPSACTRPTRNLWSPYVIGQTIYIFILVCSFFLLLFSSPNLSRRGVDVCHTCTHGVALVRNYLRCRSETCCTRLAENTGRKKSPKIVIWAPSHKFVGLYLRNWGTYRQSEKYLLSSNMSSTCLYNMANFGPLIVIYFTNVTQVLASTFYYKTVYDQWLYNSRVLCDDTIATVLKTLES